MRAPCATVVRDAVRRRLCAALAALALCAMAACSGDDGGSASSSVAPSTTTAGGTSTTTSTSLSPTTTAVLDVPAPDLAALPTDDLPSGAAGESPAAEVAPPSSVAPGSTSSVPLAPGVREPGDGRRAAERGRAAGVARSEDPLHRAPASRRRVRGVVDGRRRHHALHRLHPAHPRRVLALLRRQRHLGAAGEPSRAVPGAAALHWAGNARLRTAADRRLVVVPRRTGRSGVCAGATGVPRPVRPRRAARSRGAEQGHGVGKPRAGNDVSAVGG